MPTKRIGCIADLHCGHLVGLTPPAYQLNPRQKDTPKQAKWAAIQRDAWAGYLDGVRRMGHVHCLVVNGDCIEGKGSRSGGTELLTSDREVQCEMAVAAIKCIKADTIVMTFGTPYHTGDQEDWESSIARDLPDGTKIGSHEWVDVNGKVFDFKHFVGGSSIPHGQFTAPARDWLWNVLWAEHEEQPKADVIVRSHIHRASYCGVPGEWDAYTTPALQAMGSKFGSRRCTARVHFGFYWWDVTSDGHITFDHHKVPIKSQRARAIKI